MNGQLAHFNKARRELQLAASIDEVKDIRDKAEALRMYMKQSGETLEMQNKCAEIKIRAERRAGELLRNMQERGEMRTQEQGRPQKVLHDETLFDDTGVSKPLSDIGLTRIQSHRFKALADIPEEEFEKHIAEKIETKQELTSSGMYREAQKAKQKTLTVEPEPFPTGSYRAIVIDPPWDVQKILRDVRPYQDKWDYPSMTVEEIADLPVAELANPDGCHVYLWTTHKYLPGSFDIFEAWGVKYQCLLTWVKNVGITPFSWMYSTELVLFGRVGSLDLLVKGKRLDFTGKVREHSRKPDEFYELVKTVSPGNRLEMFAREKRNGFDSWGNETEKFQDRQAN